MARKTPPVPAVPKGTGISGGRLWRDVTSRYELEQHELLLLREAARVVDLLDKLAAVIERDGPTKAGGRTHPAVLESRQQQIVLARLLAALRLPTGDEADQPASRRPQRRSGARGVYPMRPADAGA